MKVYIKEDKIIDSRENKILNSGFFIFKEAVRYCNRQGWKWYYLHDSNILEGQYLWKQLGHILSPRLPEKYLFYQSLYNEIYDALVKYSTSPVPRPYYKTREIIRTLRKRGDGEFFGLWFVYHETGIYFASGSSRAQLVWSPEAEEESVLIEKAN